MPVSSTTSTEQRMSSRTPASTRASQCGMLLNAVGLHPHVYCVDRCDTPPLPPHIPPPPPQALIAKQQQLTFHLLPLIFSSPELSLPPLSLWTIAATLPHQSVKNRGVVSSHDMWSTMELSASSPSTSSASDELIWVSGQSKSKKK